MRARALLRLAERSAPAAVLRGVESSSSGLEGVRSKEVLVAFGVGVWVLSRFFGGRPRLRGVTFGCSSGSTCGSWFMPLVVWAEVSSKEISDGIGSLDLVLTALLRLRFEGVICGVSESSVSANDRDRFRRDRGSSVGEGSGAAFFGGIVTRKETCGRQFNDL